MKAKRYMLILAVLAGSLAAKNLTKEEAIDYNVNTYPEAQLADLYKSFYQDSFGPGHILADTASSRKYYEYELSDTAAWTGPVYEFTGCGENFVRLNMDLVRNGIIPQEEYFQAFVAGLGQLEKPEDETWITDWLETDSIVKAKGIRFPNEESDRALIDEKIATRKFTMHHSAAYDSIYRFHYRIISLPEFRKLRGKYNF